MLDALRAGRDRPLHGGGRVGMHRDVGVPVFCDLDGGAQFGLGEGRQVERAARRRDAAAAHDLDLRSALGQLLAHPQADLVGAVDDGRRTRALDGARDARRAREVGQSAQVAVAAAAGDHGAAGIDARPWREPFVDRLLEGEGRAAQIPHRREAPHQRALGFRGGGHVDVADVALQQHGQRHGRKEGMPVRVDQPRHQDAAAAVDGLSPGGRGGRAGADRLDPIAFDQQVAVAQRGRPAVEDAHVGEEGGAALRRCRRLGLDAKGEAERGHGSRHAGHEAAPRQIGVDTAAQGLEFRAMAEADGASYLGVFGQ
jgi:hypothetical protein